MNTTKSTLISLPWAVNQSECLVGSGGQIFLSPGQSGGTMGRSDQSYYRGSVRGIARGGKGLAHSYFRSSGGHRGIYPLFSCLLPSLNPIFHPFPLSYLVLLMHVSY